MNLAINNVDRHNAQRADLVELVDTLDLGSSALWCESSSLSVGTTSKLLYLSFHIAPKEVVHTYWIFNVSVS